MEAQNPALYHITHIDNLGGILARGGLLANTEIGRLALSPHNIGLKHIKQRRQHRAVPVAAQGVLADYVPFNFCGRSVMLYAIAQGHSDYQGGEDEVIHLVARFESILAAGGQWAFTDRHAELSHALYFDAVEDLGEVRWDIMAATYWADVKEERQAEFLVHKQCPWTAIVGVVVKSSGVKARVESMMAATAHRPPVVVRESFYYK